MSAVEKLAEALLEKGLRARLILSALEELLPAHPLTTLAARYVRGEGVSSRPRAELVLRMSHAEWNDFRRLGGLEFYQLLEGEGEVEQAFAREYWFTEHLARGMYAAWHAGRWPWEAPTSAS